MVKQAWLATAPATPGFPQQELNPHTLTRDA
jgi:hypothetical protein